MDPSLEACAAGMRSVGHPVDASALRRAVDAAICLRWSLARDILVALEERRPVRRGSALDEPPEAALAELITLSGTLFGAMARLRPYL